MIGAHLSRRQVLLTSLLCGTSLAASAAMARMGGGAGIPWVAGTAPYPRGFDGARFFTPAEYECVEALVSRLIPADDLGPGAREAGAADFIDNQLAGSFGRGERWYMQGPFADGLKTQGYQAEHAPAELYRAAIAALDEHCRRNFDGSVFAELDGGEQDAILTQIEKEELELSEVSAAAFFALLQENTIEGFFSDPIYGGNRDMIGWKLVGFPGVRYNYRDYLDHDGEKISIEPAGLMGRPRWNID